MKPIRVYTAGLPNLLRQIFDRTVRDQSDMEMTGHVAKFNYLSDKNRRKFDVLVTSFSEDEMMANSHKRLLCRVTGVRRF